MAVIIWFPDKPIGIVKYVINAPSLFEVKLAGDMVTFVLPILTIIALFGVNPFPRSCTVVPTEPEVRVNMRFGGVNAKSVVAPYPELKTRIKQKTTATLARARVDNFLKQNPNFSKFHKNIHLYYQFTFKKN